MIPRGIRELAETLPCLVSPHAFSRRERRRFRAAIANGEMMATTEDTDRGPGLMRMAGVSPCGHPTPGGTGWLAEAAALAVVAALAWLALEILARMFPGGL